MKTQLSQVWPHRPNARCWKPNSAPVLRNRALGAETDTDVLQIEVETMLTKFHSLADSELISRSLGHALRIAGAALLEVDTREVSFAGARVGNGGWGIHLFDSAAGGSGHIASLLRDQSIWFSKAIELLRRNQDHGRRCRDACLACILDAQSQADFEKGETGQVAHP